MLLSASSGMDFISLYPDARGNSLSYADISDRNDISGLNYNPALLGNIENNSISLSHLTWIAGFMQEQAGFGKKFNFGTLGLNASFLYNTSIVKTDIYGQELGEINAYNVLVHAGWAKNLNLLGTSIGVGVGIKYIRSVLDEYKGNSVSLDLGIIYNFENLQKLKLGLAVQNVGLPMKYESEGTMLPINVQCGASYFILDKGSYQLKLFGSAGYNLDNSLYFPVGVEGKLFEMIYLRAGYLFAQDHLRNLSTGIGVQISRLSIDLGYLPNIGTDMTYVATLGYKW